MIDIKSLEFAYKTGEFRLAIANLSLPHGEKLAVIGPSGSGKTTLLHLIAGIYLPERGSIHVGNEHVSQLSDVARRDYRITNIGFVFQNFELLDYLSIFDNIVHPYRITHALKLDNDVRRRASQLAEQMGIADKLQRHPRELSQGEQQRAAICRALLLQPKVILADEATGNLDPDNKTRILDLLFESVAQHDATLLAVTHDHELLARFDRVVDFADFRQPIATSA